MTGEKEDKKEERKEEQAETLTTTIEIDKELFLKFKALCVLNEATLSGEIEKLIRKRVEQMASNEDTNTLAKE